jgi:hypothetical protein
MSIDAMQQALEALEAINEMSKPPMNIPLAAEIDGAMDALRKAIRESALDGLAQTSQEIEWDTSDMAHRSGGLSVEQAEKQEKLCKYCGGIGRVVCDGRCMPEQEPVAWMYKNGIYMSDPSNSVSPEFVITPLYTASPKREWVGLTDEEIVEILDFDNPTIRKFAYAIEAKLKERNNG